MNTIIEKIRAEVERRRDLYYKYCVKIGFGTTTEARYREDVELLSFLDTLEKEEKPTTAEGLEEAVELDYTLEDGRIEIEGDPLPCLNPILNLPFPKFKPGQKVKLIIVKED